MSDLYAVRVLGVSRQAVRLSVARVHPDAGKPAPHAVFALMLIYDPIEKAGDAGFSKYRHLNDAALVREAGGRKVFTAQWMNANAQAFVSKVKRSGPFLDIQLTHPAWGEHLRKGMAWRTTAYDVGPGLPAEPRVPAPEQAAVPRSPGERTPKAAGAGAQKAAKAKSPAKVKKAAVKKTVAKKATKVKSAAKKAARAKRSG
ncbi:hypothetical protein JYJ95_12645 [Corallococcus exiguus]|uniref:hypothetical protein n=1 Tax=Corallococcus exiguus TaxID=83462 RepID=UPI001A8DE12B|nr:hypothetical protein [Corallococcus exiguus]MBN8467364.1 hypothetical protein [Corallococcus exiguus]